MKLGVLTLVFVFSQSVFASEFFSEMDAQNIKDRLYGKKYQSLIISYLRKGLKDNGQGRQ